HPRNSSTVSPTWTRSPDPTRATPRMVSPFRVVPLVDPRSSTHQPSSLRKIRAWAELTKVSSRTMVDDGLRPMLTSPLRSKVRPVCDGGSTTTMWRGGDDGRGGDGGRGGPVVGTVRRTGRTDPTARARLGL